MSLGRFEEGRGVGLTPAVAAIVVPAVLLPFGRESISIWERRKDKMESQIATCKQLQQVDNCSFKTQINLIFIYLLTKIK